MIYRTFRAATFGIVSAAVLISACTTDDTSAPVAAQDKAQNAKADFVSMTPTYSGDAFSAEGLQALEDRLHAFVADGDTGGLSALLVKDGEIVQYVEAGFQNESAGVLISEDTIFRIYSMTKPIIGVAMMMLYEDGLYQLDDPVSSIIPEFADLKVFTEPDKSGERQLVAMEREPTIADLMAHMAGFSYGFLPDDPLTPLYAEKQILGSPNLDVLIDRLSDTALLHQPGARWNYSVATDIQGAIIERLTGMTLGEFLQQRLFDPLGMKDTGFRVPESDFNRMADGFYVDPASGDLVKMSEAEINMMGVVYREGAPTMESGGFGLASTLPDYARFVQMLANKGEYDDQQFLKPETLKLMRVNKLAPGSYLDTPGLMGDNNKPGTGFGLNFGVVYDAEASPTPYGQDTYFWGGLASTWFWIDPEHDLYHIGMVQVYPTAAPVADFRRQSADKIYAALKD